MTSPARYLFRMVVFVVAVLIVGLALYGGLVDAFNANPVLNGVIFGVLLVGIIYTFRAVMSLSQEIRWIQNLQAYRPSVGGQLPRTRLLAPMAQLLTETSQSGKIMITTTSMRSVLDGLASRLDEGREISRYLVGLLIFLGLLGTFWGLLLTIGSVGEVIGNLRIESGDLAILFGELQDGLQAPLTGMGTAFSSSLFGLAGSLVLGFLELQASQAQNRFYNDIEEWLSENATLTNVGGGLVDAGANLTSGAYAEAVSAQTAENLAALQRLMSTHEDERQRNQRALLDLTEKLAALDEHLKIQHSLMVQLAESQTDLKPILSRLADSLISGRMGIDEASKAHLRNVDAAVARLLEELTSGRDRTVEEIRSEIKVLARTIVALAQDDS